MRYKPYRSFYLNEIEKKVLKTDEWKYISSLPLPEPKIDIFSHEALALGRVESYLLATLPYIDVPPCICLALSDSGLKDKITKSLEPFVTLSSWLYGKGMHIQDPKYKFDGFYCKIYEKLYRIHWIKNIQKGWKI